MKYFVIRIDLILKKKSVSKWRIPIDSILIQI